MTSPPASSGIGRLPVRGVADERDVREIGRDLGDVSVECEAREVRAACEACAACAACSGDRLRAEVEHECAWALDATDPMIGDMDSERELAETL